MFEVERKRPSFKIRWHKYTLKWLPKLCNTYFKLYTMAKIWTSIYLSKIRLVRKPFYKVVKNSFGNNTIS